MPLDIKEAFRESGLLERTGAKEKLIARLPKIAETLPKNRNGGKFALIAWLQKKPNRKHFVQNLQGCACCGAHAPNLIDINGEGVIKHEVDLLDRQRALKQLLRIAQELYPEEVTIHPVKICPDCWRIIKL